jgi:hypothetical protein
VRELLDGDECTARVSAAPVDTFLEMASNDEAFKQDPTGSMPDEEHVTAVHFVKGCCGPYTPIVHPESVRLFLWILLGVLFVVYECFMTPYRLCFEAPAEGPYFIFEAVVNIYFIFDVFLHFFVSFRDQQGQIVMDHSIIMKKYVQGWFMLDVIASVPIDWILMYVGDAVLVDESTSGAERATKILRLVRLARFFKLSRILRVGKLRAFADRFEQELVGSSWRLVAFSMMKIVTMLMLIAHVAGCFWYLVGRTFQDRYGVSWLTEKMPQYDVDDGFTKNTLYFWSCHFAVATMSTVGYGDISPTNTAELVYTGVLLWSSLVAFSGCLGVLMNIVSGVYEEGQERRTRLAELAKYMNWRDLPRDMRVSLRRYVNFVWDCSAKFAEEEKHVMDTLSPTLRSKLAVHIYGAALARCPFLSWIGEDNEAMKKLCLSGQSYFLEANDLLF